MIAETYFPYMAGVTDGEGTITLAKQTRKDRPSPSYKQMVTVSNCDKRILKPFLDAFGGIIYTTKEKREGYSDCSIWHCPQGKVEEFLKSIIPFLQGKKEQATLLLKFIDYKNTTKRNKGTKFGCKKGGSDPFDEEELNERELYWQKFKVLNAKGKFKE